MKEKPEERVTRILRELNTKFPKAKAYDLDGNKNHFVSEIEPVTEHPEYDRAIEVIISSRSHKHLKTTQYYTIISGDLELHAGDNIVKLHKGDTYVVKPGTPHWARSDNEAWVEIYSKPGWTKEDHITIN